ncbi:hypothetical protein OSB04_031461 [Centaurea solstitialis]|uniref:Uncharacterized protein n=1 Tax=Centaurea solstitialis TaxID=347529 RepID=A0AA38SH27_9ASTR|nr:hypothetical protein OSB04_031461 [Centaurea solstitialis]
MLIDCSLDNAEFFSAFYHREGCLNVMDMDDKFVAKGSCVQSLSSSVHSTPEKKVTQMMLQELQSHFKEL